MRDSAPGNEGGVGPDGSGSASVLPPLACSGATLTRMPVPSEYVATMGQLGSLVPPDHTFPTPHFYFYTKNPNNPSDIEAPVYAPGNLRLTSVTVRHYDKLRGGTPNYIDYSLIFNICDDVDIYFHHVRSIVFPKLKTWIEARQSACVWAGDGGTSTGGGSNEQPCNLEPPREVISLAAGEQLGTAGDIRGVGGLDMGMRDWRLTTGRDYINADRHCKGARGVFSRCNAVCPLDYVDATERAKYINLFSTMGRPVESTNKCGTVYWDVAGTAQGYWFPTDPKYPSYSEEYVLFMAASPAKPSVEVFSMGRAVPDLNGQRYAFAPKSSGLTNRRFADVKDSQIYCFDDLHNNEFDMTAQNALPYVIVAQFVSSAMFKVEKQTRASCGTGPFAFAGKEASFTR
jgi:hypothetical protein